MRSGLEHNKGYEVDFHTLLLACERRVLVGDVVLIHDSPSAQFFDPDGTNRTITLPSLRRGRFYFIAHVGTDNTLTVVDDAASTVAVIYPGEMHPILCSGDEWASSPDVFSGSGPGATTGLVPRPPLLAGTTRFLREDGVFVDPGFTGDNAYTQVTDGTTTAIAVGADTFKLRSGNAILTVTVADDDVTHGDNALFTVNEGSINHDALSGFVADEHVAHSGVSIGTAANSGLAGGGTIAASRSLSLDINNLASVTPVLGDSFALFDADGLVTGKATLTALNGILDHDALVNFDPDEHVDHTAVSIAGGTGLTGGGTIDASRTISLDFNNLSSDTPVLADILAFFDVGGGDYNKCTFTVLNGILDHDALFGFVANEHIDHTSVSIATAANSGLAGGGTIAATRNLSVDIGGLTEITSLEDDADFFMVLDATDSTLKKVKPENLPASGGQSRLGEFFWFTGNDAPSYAILADGGSYSRATYADLWTWIQTSGNLAASQGAKTAGEYGPGDGSTTFTTPDLMTTQRFIRAASVGTGVGTLQDDATAVNGLSATTTATANALTNQPNTGGAFDMSRGPAGAGVTINSSDSETRPLNVAFLPCIVAL